MFDPTSARLTRSSTTALQHAFLTILPRIARHARVYFRHVRCHHARQEAVAETVALAWKWYARLIHRGKHPERFVSAIASYAARAVNSGRRLCGHERARDILSPVAQTRHAFALSPLPQISTLHGNPFDEALHDNTLTPVPDQVSFRVDFPAWLSTRSERDRELIGELMAGERTQDAAEAFSISPSRVSQLRREFHQSWVAFCDRPEEVSHAGDREV